eukprot:2966988-Rhodomonas_salina.2
MLRFCDGFSCCDQDVARIHHFESYLLDMRAGMMAPETIDTRHLELSQREVVRCREESGTAVPFRSIARRLCYAIIIPAY